MIQAFTIGPIQTDICTEDNRINTSVASTQIRFLVKFINDLDGSVEYGYPELRNGIKPRFTEMNLSYFSPIPNIFNHEIKLLPAGHWKYEVYEVSWIGTVSLSLKTAPVTETEVLPVSDDNGVVEGIVTKGILNLTESPGTEQVQYTQHTAPSGTNYIYTGTSSPSFANLYSLSFDGVDDYVNLGDSSDFTFGDGSTDSPFSISMWVKLADGVVQGFIAKSSSSQKEYHIITSGSGLLRFRLYDNSTGGYIQSQMDAAASTLSWVNYIFTYDGSGDATGINIYADNSLVAQTQSGFGTYTAMENTTADLRVSSSEQNNFYLEGNTDEVALFNIELSSSQVTDIYNSGAPTDLTSHTGLIGYWRNGDTAGTSVYPTITDDSSNSNDGTMTNMDSGDIVTDVP